MEGGGRERGTRELGRGEVEEEGEGEREAGGGGREGGGRRSQSFHAPM